MSLYILITIFFTISSIIAAIIGTWIGNLIENKLSKTATTRSNHDENRLHTLQRLLNLPKTSRTIHRRKDFLFTK